VPLLLLAYLNNYKETSHDQQGDREREQDAENTLGQNQRGHSADRDQADQRERGITPAPGGRSERRAAMTSRASAVAWEALAGRAARAVGKEQHSSALECCSERNGDPLGNAKCTKMCSTS
jgi:hypothetical protein